MKRNRLMSVDSIIIKGKYIYVCENPASNIERLHIKTFTWTNFYLSTHDTNAERFIVNTFQYDFPLMTPRCIICLRLVSQRGLVSSTDVLLFSILPNRMRAENRVRTK